MRFWKGKDDIEPGADLHLVVGLGNPGSRFESTRHNVGFMVVDELARRQRLSFRKQGKHRAESANGEIEGVSVLLARPLTFMNESGYAVSHLLRYYRAPLEQLLIVNDDIDLPFGTLRLRPNGSSGGNQGLNSIVRELGTQEFARLRIGVERPRSSAVSHVLGEFPPEQTRLLPGLIEKAADAVTSVLKNGVQPTMNSFNRNWTEELAGVEVEG
jgi:peptidyl-tRNA hydrolase, PTH1 family